MPLSSTAQQDASSPNRTEIWLFIIEISHPTITTMRFVGNTEDIVSNGETYTAAGLTMAMPDEDPDSIPKMTIQLEDFSTEVLTVLRNIQTQNVERPRVSGSLVLASNPDQIQLGPIEGNLEQYVAAAGVLKITVGADNITAYSFPSFNFDPQWFTTLF